MKAIINVSKTSSYSYLNGHTFPVDNILGQGNKIIIAMRIPNDFNIGYKIVDFSPKEVFIIDLKDEIDYRQNMQRAATLNKAETWRQMANDLKAYAKAKNIKI